MALSLADIDILVTSTVCLLVERGEVINLDHSVDDTSFLKVYLLSFCAHRASADYLSDFQGTTLKGRTIFLAILNLLSGTNAPEQRNMLVFSGLSDLRRADH